ncbi:MAG: MMPL family transporter [Planctomycetota bacterium]
MNLAGPDETGGPLPWWVDRVTARPGVTLLVVLGLCGVALLVALRIEPATGVADMLADDQPSSVALGQVVGRYALVDDLVVLARLPEGSVNANPARLIGFAARLQAELTDEPIVADVRYRPTAQATAFVEEVLVPRGWHYLDEAQRGALVERLRPEAMRAQFRQNAAMLAAPGAAAGQLAKRLVRDPLRLREFLAGAGAGLRGGDTAERFFDGDQTPGGAAMVSPDGRAILVRITGTESANDLDFTAAFMPAVRDAVGRANADDLLRVDYTGAYAIAELSASRTRSDMIRACTGSVLLLVAVFLVVYRHPLAFWLLKLPVYAAVVGAFGVYALLSGRLTPVTAVAGAVLAGLGIDYAVHVLSHHEAQRRAGADDRTAARRTAAAVGPAVGAACVTSLIGFAAVLASGVQSLREFAVLGMLGLALAWLAAFTVLPALLARFGRGRRGERSLSAARFDLGPVVRRIAATPGAWLGGGVCVVTLLGVVVVSTARGGDGWSAPVGFDDDLHALHPQPHPPLETQDTLAEVFGAAPNSLTILVEGNTPDDMLRAASATQRRLNRDDTARRLGLAGVFGPATLMPPPPPEVVAPRPEIERVLQDFRRSAEAEGFAVAAFTEYETFLQTLLTAERPTWAEVWAFDELAGLVLPRGEAEPTQGLVLATLTRPWATTQQRNDSLDAVRGELAGIDGATLTGISVVGYDTQRAIGGRLSRLLLIAGGLVLVWLAVFFRRPSDLLLALLPAGAGLLGLVAGAAAFGWSLNAINLIALPLVVGIGVDDGVMLTALARHARRRGLDRQTLTEHLAASAHAVTMTSLTTGLAFGSLAFTSVPAIRTLGGFTAVGVGAAWLASLILLLPALVIRHRAVSSAVSTHAEPSAA